MPPRELEWYDTADGPRPACERCVAYISRPHFVSACASVGISQRRSTFAVVRDAVQVFHERGHR